MTPHFKLQTILAKDKYKRGEFKGDAPMENRCKSHFRALALNNGDMAVRFYQTNIITVDKDTNNLTIHCNGYAEDSPTTREALNHSLRELLPMRATIGSVRFKGITHHVISANNGVFRYYDGCVLSPEGDFISEPRKFHGKRVDKAATAQLKIDVQESGFKDMFRILWGSCTEDMTTGRVMGTDHANIINPAHADKWAGLIAWYAYDFVLVRGASQYVKQPPSLTWSRIMQAAKAGMVELYETEVTNLTAD